MNDIVVSYIRTTVPVVAGVAISWLATRGVAVDESTATALTAGLVGLVSSLYYLIVRTLETKYPSVGWLLGVAKKPKY